MEITSVSIAVEQLTNLLNTDTGIAQNQDLILKLLRNAMEQKVPLFITDNNTGKKYRWLDGQMIEIAS